MRTEVSKFAVHSATSLSHAISLLSQYGQEAVVINGATDVISRNKNGIKLHMFQHLVDISGLALNYANKKSDGWHIGAGTPINGVATNTSLPTVLQQAA